MDTVAMHIVNGIVDAPTSLAFAAVAAAALVLCVARARDDLDERMAPMAGITAAFIFAAQMLMFPVLPGVAGHLLGAALAAALVGPWVGALCVSIVLIVQVLLFADGGVTALGLMIVNMALIGGFVAYGLLVLLLKALPRNAAGVAAAAGIAAWASVVAGASGFVFEYAVGGATDLGSASGAMAVSMIGVHALIGIGEGIITVVVVLAVARSRPDLVYALRGGKPALAPAAVGGAA
ncbi:MAG: energy-coupling factor ABC transporter permease [Stackebrandtia sp.]